MDKNMLKSKTNFSMIASRISKNLTRVNVAAATDRDAEWQRVNSYVADVLKDSHVLYAKLARLQGDFTGEELDHLEKIAEATLIIGDKLSEFVKAFYDGKYSMVESGFSYGDDGQPKQEAPKQEAPKQEAPKQEESESEEPADESYSSDEEVEVEVADEDSDEDEETESYSDEEEKEEEK